MGQAHVTHEGLQRGVLVRGDKGLGRLGAARKQLVVQRRHLLSGAWRLEQEEVLSVLGYCAVSFGLLKQILGDENDAHAKVVTVHCEQPHQVVILDAHLIVYDQQRVVTTSQCVIGPLDKFDAFNLRQIWTGNARKRRLHDQPAGPVVLHGI